MRLASAVLNSIPTFATGRLPQSFCPSPHINTMCPCSEKVECRDLVRLSASAEDFYCIPIPIAYASFLLRRARARECELSIKCTQFIKDMISRANGVINVGDPLDSRPSRLRKCRAGRYHSCFPCAGESIVAGKRITLNSCFFEPL
jgi:hypothetical protein